uniref:Myocilin opposite strand n=1 Tax=Microcebus murinus TaxID=30608 RepID=A0A8C5Y2Y3_MICMU
MAQKGPEAPAAGLHYEDLASEVTRRRVTMSTREEIVTKESEDGQETPSHPGLEQEPPPDGARCDIPPAPPPSPTEESSMDSPLRFGKQGPQLTLTSVPGRPKCPNSI